MMKREADESNVFTYTLMVIELSLFYLLSKLTVDGAFNIHKQEFEASAMPGLETSKINKTEEKGFYQPRSGMVMGWVGMLFLFFLFWGHLAFGLSC